MVKPVCPLPRLSKIKLNHLTQSAKKLSRGVQFNKYCDKNKPLFFPVDIQICLFNQPKRFNVYITSLPKRFYLLMSNRQ